jgi:hypothetical protein
VENLEDNGDMTSSWDTIRDNNKVSAKDSIGFRESKHNKTWFDENI